MGNSRIFAASTGNRRLALVLLGLLATVGIVVAAVARAPSVLVSLVAPDDPYVALDREITAEFGMQNPVVWVVVARDGSVWTEPVLSTVQALTRDVFTIPGVIALDVVSLASPNLRDLRVTEDALEPVYLMGQVPETPEAIDRLRQRVDGDPNYRGTLVSEDGRAAMVVGNFRNDADPQAIARASVALRDRYEGARAAIYVTGAPLLGAMAPQAARPIVVGAAVILGVGLLVLALLAGARTALAATLAAVLAPLWATAVVVALGAAVLPWTAYAAVPTAVLAVAAATVPRMSGRSVGLIGLALAAGFCVLAGIAGAPAAAFGVAGAVGSIAAVVAGYAARALTHANDTLVHPVEGGSAASRLWLIALLLIAVALTDRPGLRTSFGMFGYGERYLPEAAVGDLRALARHFPPPTALAIRFRGERGFVESPAVLAAFDGVAQALRNDPAVVRVLSLADIVKMVNRAFNQNREEFLKIPDDRGMVARYLALAYSPQFRRFVDRAFTRSAIWVYLSSDSPADLARVSATIRTQLAAQPVPGAEADLFGGDGAVVLVAARLARWFALGALAFVLLSAVALGVLCGPRVGAAALAGGMSAAIVAAGAFGWLGVPIDLLSLPCAVIAVAAGVALGAAGDSRGIVWALAAMAVLALATAFTGANQLGTVIAVLFGGPAFAAFVTQPFHVGSEQYAVGGKAGQ